MISRETSVFVLLISVKIALSVEYCFVKDPVKPQQKEFALYTAYHRIRGENLNPEVEGCNVTNLWYLSRHGARAPHPGEFQDIGALHELQQKIVQNWERRKSKEGLLCEEDLELLKNWEWDKSIVPSEDMGLHPQGYEDTVNLGKEIRKAFSGLLRIPPEKGRYDIRSTDTSRTIDSLDAWVGGVFGEGALEELDIPDPTPSAEDTLLKPADNCEYLLPPNPTLGLGCKAFRESSVFENMMKEVSDRLGFDATLTIHDINNMVAVCRKEASWIIDRPSPWCAAFQPEHFNITAYDNDAYTYTWTGYGREGNEFATCFTVKDLYEKFTNPEARPVSAYFSHDQTMNLFYVALGIAKDEKPLEPNNYEAMIDRKWKSQEVTPMNVNLAVVKYDCGSDGEKVGFYLNERRMEERLIPWCPDGFCEIQKLWDQLGYLLKMDCAQNYCRNTSGEKVRSVISPILFLGVIFRLFW